MYCHVTDIKLLCPKSLLQLDQFRNCSMLLCPKSLLQLDQFRNCSVAFLKLCINET
jgi:hypothetical protein